MEFNPKDVRVHLWSKKNRGAWSVEAPTGIEITHMPSGIVVTHDDGKSAHGSKVKAMREIEQRVKRIHPDAAQKETMSELEAINDAAQKIMKDFPDVAQGKLSTVLHVCHDTLRENAELKEKLTLMKIEFDIVKNICDEFEADLDQAPDRAQPPWEW
jgi:hypothetical protein